MAARLTLLVMKISVALPMLGVAWKVGKAKNGALFPGEGFFDGN